MKRPAYKCTPEYKQKAAAYARARRATPEGERVRKAYRARKEVKERRRAYWCRQDQREKSRAYHRRKEVLARRRDMCVYFGNDTLTRAQCRILGIDFATLKQFTELRRELRIQGLLSLR